MARLSGCHHGVPLVAQHRLRSGLAAHLTFTEGGTAGRKRSAPDSICICICTAQRTRLLRRLLERIEQLQIPDGIALVSVLVVDNNRVPEAEALVRAWVPKATIRFAYIHEPRSGLSYARNAALQHAADLGDLAALIDDDEDPSGEWLIRLYEMWSQTRSPLLTGPVIAVYPPDIAPWIREGRFFDLESWTDGQLLTEGISGNAMLHLPTIKLAGLRFDEALSRSGGEDQLFFRQARAAGLDIRAASRATVFEEVPVARATLRYLIRREFRKGNTLGLLAADHPELGERRPYRLAAALKWFARGLGRIASALILVVRSSPRAKVVAVVGLLEVVRALGMVSGTVGWRYDLYDRVSP